MKTRALITGVAALFLATGAAHAAEIPKQYHGAWCPTEWKTIYERCDKNNVFVDRIIGPTWWGLDDEGCTLTAISKSKYGGHRLSGKCGRTDPAPSDIEGHTEERWWLGSNNTRLQIIEKMENCGGVDKHGREIKCE